METEQYREWVFLLTCKTVPVVASLVVIKNRLVDFIILFNYCKNINLKYF